jgi:hypothetical protein
MVWRGETKSTNVSANRAGPFGWGRVAQPKLLVCHSERSEVQPKAGLPSSQIARRASLPTNWILHFVQNDKPGLKTLPETKMP